MVTRKMLTVALTVCLLVQLSQAQETPGTREHSVMTHALQGPDAEETVDFTTEMEEETDDQTGDQDGALPDNLQLHFNVGEDQVALNLTRNQHVSSRVPVFIGKDGDIQMMEAEDSQTFGVYYDVENMASIMMTSHEGSSGSTEHMYSGTFRTNTGEFALRPAVSEHRRRKRDVTRAVTDTTYYVYNIPTEANVYEDDTNDRFNFTAWLGPRSQYADIPPGPYNLGVELLMALDFGAFGRWRELTRDLTPNAGETEILNNMIYYYTHVANGMDLRLMNIDHSRMAFYTRLVAFYIATTPDSSRFTQLHTIYEPGEDLGYAEAYDSLDAFQLWLDDHEDDLPIHDQATLFTGYSLYTGRRDDGTLRTIHGLGDIKGICTYHSSTINVDWNQHQAAQTATHELGHSLGAIHDGSANSCDSSDQYIMAVSPGVLTEDTYDNVFSFSYCSVDDVVSHMDALLFADKNCLLDGAEWWNAGQVEQTLQFLPGQFLSWDQQCQYSYGVRSYYCAGQLNDELMCEMIMCYNPMKSQCTTSVELRAADGTTCDNNKWCRRGRCEFDVDAPSAPDYCLSGDMRGEFYHTPGKTCDTIRYETPVDCYSALYSEPCCLTCELIADTQHPDCPYGDKHQYCEDIEDNECYAENTRATCCRTCREVLRPVEGCEFGDRASWCKTSPPGQICYNQRDICCEICEEIRDESNPDCPWGDAASWCEDLSQDRCYYTADAERCCARCAQFRTNILGCEYGDRLRDCTNRDCSQRYYQDNCCYTCRDYVDAPTVPPTTSTTTSTTSTTTATTAASTTRTTTTTTTSTAPGTTKKMIVGSEGDSEEERDCQVAGVDTAQWCETILPHNCYADHDVCCHTCPGYKTNIPGCMYGDRFSWCPTIFPGQCYQESVQDGCCLTCPRHYRNVIDCEYGDFYSWCANINRDRCSEPDIMTSCCVTCMDEVPPMAQPATTTSHVITTRFQTTTGTPVECSSGDRAGWCPEHKYRAVCYNDPDTCCATCRARWTGIPGCEYGDKVSWCPEIEMNRCNTDTYYMEQCCQTCAPFIASTVESDAGAVATTDPTTSSAILCPSGDMASWCRNFPSYLCYTSHETCCATCMQYYTAVEGCEFGDKHEACSDVKSTTCYYPDYPEICCDRCGQFETGIEDCRYGDRLDDCHNANCADPIARHMCCGTCAEFDDVATTVLPSFEFVTLDFSDGCVDLESWCPTIPPQDCYEEAHLCCHTCSQYFTGIQGV